MRLPQDAYDLLVKNRRVTDGHQYTLPSPSRYPYQWLWDSCFHAIVLAKFDPDAAKAELRSLLSKQFSDGLVPHIIFWDRHITRPYNLIGWGKDGTSSITQPPMIAYAAWEIYRHTKDATFLSEIFIPLLNYYRHLVGKRDPQDHHLAGIINPDESGEDNSSRFDAPMHVDTEVSFLGHMYERYKLVKLNRTCNFDAETCMREHFWVKDVPFNAILVKNLDVLGKIAALLGHTEGEHFATLHASLIKKAMRERLLVDGIFLSAAGPNYERLNVASWAHFAPLFADLYMRHEAEDLIRKHFHNEDTFLSPWGIRTVSKEEPSYRPDGFWRGPIWMAPHWFIYKGLVSYGFKEEAAWLRERSIALLEKNGFRELFNPETGEGYGAYNFTWGTLVTDMIDE